MIIKNINGGFSADKKAAMFFKTEPFYSDIGKYTHTNNWEIVQSIRILNSRGYTVDLIDRDCSNWQPEHKYDLFLGLGVGNSGRHFARYSKMSQAEKRVLLAMGPQPDVSNERVVERYEYFNKRTGLNAKPMRTVTEVIGEKYRDIINETDYIFNIGEKGSQSSNSYIGSKIPVLNFFPSISPKVKFQSHWMKSRKRNAFLCFAGNGFICKGVDLVLEAFLQDTSKELHICGPDTEKIFFQHYAERFNKAPNLYWHGFIDVGGQKFNKLASHCSYVVFHSAAESCCTSVATAMKAGLVPIINSWTSIKIDGGVGIELQEDGDRIATIKNETDKACLITKEDYEEYVTKTLQKASDFSQSSFTKSYASALDYVIKN